MARHTIDDIDCPHCGYRQQDLYEQHELITYWAEDGPIIIQCQSCEHQFEMTEHITRLYKLQGGDGDE